jgi:hypothetical protein
VDPAERGGGKMARWLSIILAVPILLGLAAMARAETQLLFLAEDVPVGLNFDGRP